MTTATLESPSARSPLEEFVLDFVESIGGAWDLVEPAVYDLLMPSGAKEGDKLAGAERVERITFDPEALPEHRGSQLASFGTPLVDRMLADALSRGRQGQLYVEGLNVAPYDLPDRVFRSITLSPGLKLELDRVRSLSFPQAVFWFQATFTSDQKEQDIMPVAIDLHYLRQVRHLESLLDRSRLSERPSRFCAEARRSSTAAAYVVARERVVRTLSALANVRSRELGERTERQIARMTQYYSDLRGELDEQLTRTRNRGEDVSKLVPRRQAIDREEHLRIGELRQKSMLRVHLKLLNLLLVHQPKLLILAAVSRAESASEPLRSPSASWHKATSLHPSVPPNASLVEIIWDPVSETIEAVPCPSCHRPTYSLAVNRQRQVVCAECAAAPAAKTHR